MIAKWTKALRSKKYKQGTQYLSKQNKYCCLGVLYDLFGAEWVQCPYEEEAWMAKEELDRINNIEEDEKAWQMLESCGILPPKFMQEIGLDDCTADRLACMNDDGTSFAKIADWIESNLSPNDSKKNQ